VTVDRCLLARVIERIGTEHRVGHERPRLEAWIGEQQRPALGFLQRHDLGRPVKPGFDIAPAPQAGFRPLAWLEQFQIGALLPEFHQIERRRVLAELGSRAFRCLRLGHRLFLVVPRQYYVLRNSLL
jgi:hypothetical protein